MRSTIYKWQKKKKKILGPRWKRMTRSTRLINAKEWMKNYVGKNIIKGYSKWFGVDWICTMTELEMLGYPISEKRMEGVEKGYELSDEEIDELIKSIDKSG